MLINNNKDFLFSSPVVVKQIKNYLQKRGLSKRESEVVILVVQGLTNKQVADQLCVAEKTVKFHLTNVLGLTSEKNLLTGIPLDPLRSVSGAH